MTTTFDHLPLKPALLKNLATLGYHTMTPIQAASLPVMMQGQDVIAQANTGSGKTAAFGLNLLQRIDPKNFQVQSLVLCPTRELADQVAKEIRRLARAIPNIKVLTLCGGVSIGPQIGSLAHGAHIIVGTPGRVEDHLRKKTLTLEQLRILVLDEADRMLDMGFIDAITAIAQQAPTARQTLLFSATYPPGITKLSASFQHNPQQLTTASSEVLPAIEQKFYEVAKQQRNETLLALLATYQPESVIVFCNTKKKCQQLSDYLSQQGLVALALHGDLDQRERDRVMVRFANRSCSLLVATDVAARGLDVTGLDAVVNFDLSRDPEVHVHRIGRTGRAGKKGLSLSLVTPEQVRQCHAIVDYMQISLQLRDTATLDFASRPTMQPIMVTLVIDGGKKDKLRPADILGALTGHGGIAGKQVGKIDISHFAAHVAVERQVANQALQLLLNGKVKGRKFKVRQVR